VAPSQEERYEHVGSEGPDQILLNPKIPRAQGYRIANADNTDTLVAIAPLALAVLTEGASVALGAAEVAGPALETTELSGITANKVMGDAAADELAASLRQAGMTVEREVPYSTPIGTRIADLRVSLDGQVRGLIEVKVGDSPYTVDQRLKDFFIQSIFGHPTNLVRYQTYP
jgi:hypothetical protein